METNLLLRHASDAMILLSAEKPFNPVHGGAMAPQTGLHYMMKAPKFLHMMWLRQIYSDHCIKIGTNFVMSLFNHHD
eukprot:12909410-Prorocentrum_lima.AAC.1